MVGDEGPGYQALVAAQRQEREEEDRERTAAEAQKKADQHDERVRFFNAPNTETTSKSIWAGKKVKVVIKAANYILSPGQEYSGTWHLEGMPHERIVASAIYYYERDPSIVDAGLYLRRKRDGERDFPGEEEDHRDVRRRHFLFPKMVVLIVSRRTSLIRSKMKVSKMVIATKTTIQVITGMTPTWAMFPHISTSV
jgi:hypothetical protein